MLGKDAKLPPIIAPHIVELMCEAGWYELKWSELRAWQEATGMTLSAWEANAMIRMSAAYSGAVMAYNGKDEPAPYRDEVKAQEVTRSILR